MPPTAQPTPIPAFAPLESPDDEVDAVFPDGLGDEELVEGVEELVEVGEVWAKSASTEIALVVLQQVVLRPQHHVGESAFPVQGVIRAFWLLSTS